MRHRKANVKLGRVASHRDAMLRNMANALFKRGDIHTTLAKGKALQPIVDKLITIAKNKTLDSKREIFSTLYEERVAKKLLEDASTRFGDRSCGFTSVVKNGHRVGDRAPMCVVTLIDKDYIKSLKRKSSGKSSRDDRVAASKKVQAPPQETPSKRTSASSPDSFAPVVLPSEVISSSFDHRVVQLEKDKALLPDSQIDTSEATIVTSDNQGSTESVTAASDDQPSSDNQGSAEPVTAVSDDQPSSDNQGSAEPVTEAEAVPVTEAEAAPATEAEAAPATDYESDDSVATEPLKPEDSNPEDK